MKIQLRIKEILEEKGKTNYWLSQQLGMCYRNYHNIVTNQTSAVRFDTLERLCEILDVPVGDLFEQINDKQDSRAQPLQNSQPLFVSDKFNNFKFS